VSAQLTSILREEIAAAGPMTFRRFMELALYHSEHGYYSQPRTIVGKEGDFFTNVSIGSLFGKLIARQFVEMWEKLDKPETFTIVEQGAHSGDFANDVLQALDQETPECFASTHYTIVEPSARLREQQQTQLAAFTKTSWVSSLHDLPPFTGVHFSNELLDAFPIHRVVWSRSEWQEDYVVAHEDGFAWKAGALSSPELTTAVNAFPLPLPDGYKTEINLAAPQWLHDVNAKLERGFILLVDYGYVREQYFTPERHDGTLSAYARHQRQPNPLAAPGEQDLTAHVEFSSLLERATALDLALCGFTDQHHFMVGSGADYFQTERGASERRAFQTLMHPELMGASFKVLGLAKQVQAQPPLTGFQFARSPASLKLI